MGKKDSLHGPTLAVQQRNAIGRREVHAQFVKKEAPLVKTALVKPRLLSNAALTLLLLLGLTTFLLYARFVSAALRGIPLRRGA